MLSESERAALAFQARGLASVQRVQTPGQGGTPDPLVVYLAGLAPSSRATVARALRVVAGLFGVTVAEIQWQNLRYVHLVAIKDRLEAPTATGRTRSPATINAVLSHLRGIARETYRVYSE